MSYQALARKYRPQTFRDILGQETIVRTLRNAIEQQRLHHAYLFSGVRGVGKTTTARILAKAINCMQGPTIEPCNECDACREITEGIDLDVREIDAATYTQVDNIRELREVSQFQPARDRRRIFIIDEAHMLSAGAWNALLKLIEEPPPHVVFIMATTEMHKVPATILSRVQQFIFRKITSAELVERLQEICTNEGITAEVHALELIAARGEGSVRDSLSVLDQIIAFSGRSVTAADVVNILGLSEDRFVEKLVELIHDGDSAEILAQLQEAAENGRDFKLLFKDFLGYVRNLLLVASGADDRVRITTDPQRTKELASRFESTELLRILNLLLKDDEIVSRSEHQRLAVELALLKAANLPRLRAVENVLRGGAGETRSGGAPAASRGSRPTTEAVTSPGLSEGPRTASTATGAAHSAAVTPGGDFGRSLIDRVAAQRKMVAGYLAEAKQISLDGNVVSITFEGAQNFALNYLSDPEQSAMLQKTASELAGRNVEVKLAAAAAESAARAKKPATLEDPVIKAFSKHLGGEVVPQRSKRSTEGS